MKVFVKGMGEVELTQRDFIAAGGVGKVYSRGKVAYKIYDDPSKMIPVAKIQELSAIKNPNIIKPDKLILDKKNKSIGYTRRLVDGIVLCQLFTKAFKQRNNIDKNKTIDLVKDLYTLVHDTHKADILMIDNNELNFLVSNSFDEIYAIDVDSYQTKNFPATVIMDSIKDRHCNNKFTKETDWFSWGIVSFQMLIGIHPYKGSHPDFEGMSLDERLNARMLKNVSVFHPGAKFPKVCESFDSIPSALKQWYIAVFEQGTRIAPPNDFSGGIIILPVNVKQIVGSNLFDIKEVDEYAEEIISFFSYEGNRLVVVKDGVYVDRIKYPVPNSKGIFTFTPKLGHPIAAFIDGGLLKVFDIKNRSYLNVTANADDIMRYQDRIYVKNNNSILELIFTEIGGTQCLTKVVGKVLDLPSATKVFDGGVIQNLLGRHYVSIFPESGKCYQVSIAELDDYRIIDIKHENNVLIVIGVKGGKYDRMNIRFSKDFTSYDFRKIENIVYTGINFAVNDAGIAILINEEEKIEAFSNRKDSGSVKEFDDACIESDMKLFHDGSRMLFAKGNKLYSISMKK